MRIILSPAKKMNSEHDIPAPAGLPVLLEDTCVLLGWLRARSSAQLKELWKCNDKILHLNIERLEHMNPEQNLTAAILAYEGIAYQYMAPSVLEENQLSYLQDHLRILSAFYGVLKPMDGVTPYRLEMQAKCAVGNCKDLYQFWGKKLYEETRDESGVIINLASKEYSKCIAGYLQPEDRFITISFVEESKGKLVTKGTYAKMARGEMVRFMAEHQIEDPKELTAFDRLGYSCREDLSSEKEIVFQRK